MRFNVYFVASSERGLRERKREGEEAMVYFWCAPNAFGTQNAFSRYTENGMSAGDRRCANKLTYGYRALGAARRASADRPPGTLAKRHWASVDCRGSHTRTANRNAIKNTCFSFADESVDETEADNEDSESPPSPVCSLRFASAAAKQKNDCACFVFLHRFTKRQRNAYLSSTSFQFVYAIQFIHVTARARGGAATERAMEIIKTTKSTKI